MPARVVVEPSVLARTRTRFLALQTAARALSGSYHIDIMDGQFTATRSIGPNVLASTRTGSAATVHLMVDDPVAWLPAVMKSGARRVIIHAEIGPRALMSLASFRAAGCTVGLAIKMSTDLSILRTIRHLTWIHVMTGAIGRYGSRFDRRALRRIIAIRKRYPRAMISVDVGMNPKTIPAVVQAGARHIVVGSYIWSGDPRARMHELRTLIRSL